MDVENTLPEIGMLKLKEVLKITKIGKTKWYQGMKTGEYPNSIKWGKRARRWDVNDIRALLIQKKEQSKSH